MSWPTAFCRRSGSARAPGRAAFLYLFAASGLPAHTLSVWRALLLAERRRSLRGYWPGVVAVLSVALFAALAATGAVFMAVHPTETSGRLWHQIGGWSSAAAVVGVGGGLIWAYLVTNDERRVTSKEPGEIVASGQWPATRHPPLATRD